MITSDINREQRFAAIEFSAKVCGVCGMVHDKLGETATSWHRAAAASRSQRAVSEVKTLLLSHVEPIERRTGSWFECDS